jgi:hypothetical protein
MGALADLLRLTDPGEDEKKKREKREPVGALEQLLALTEPEEGQGWLTDARNTAGRSSVDSTLGPLQGLARSFGKAPELIGKAAELYTGLRSDLPEDAKRAELERIQANTKDIRPEAAKGALGAGIVGAMDAANYAADAWQETREATRKALPVDEDFESGLAGGVVSGLAQVASQIPLYLTGLGLPAAAGQMYDQAYQDAKSKGADDGTAAMAGVTNLPGAFLEAAADKLALGPLLDAVKAGKAAPNALLEQLAKRFSPDSKLGRAAIGTAGASASEAVQEGAQQVWQNLGAQALYDPQRELMEGVPMSMAVGGLVGGAARGGLEAGSAALDALQPQLDTGKNVAESEATLLAQRQELVEGRRPAMMFPAGTPEPFPPPDGFERLETPRGIFHFSPSAVDPRRIEALSAEGRENEILGLGSVSKPEAMARAAATGEQAVSVIERTPEGAEVKAALGTTGTAATQKAELQAAAKPGNTISVESPEQTILGRLQAKQEAKQAGLKQQLRKEEEARVQRQAEAQAKAARFDETMQAAAALAAKPDADYAALHGVSSALNGYLSDNSLGLRQDQRNAAAAALKRLGPRIDAAEATYRAEQDRRKIELEAQAKAEAEAKAAKVKADQAAFEAAKASGIGADGKLDYRALPDGALDERATAGDEGAQQEIIRREEEAAKDEGGEDLLTALKSVRLPTTDEGLGAELKILAQDMTPGQRLQLTRKAGMNLDQTAEALRGRGFTQIQTPDDVITYAQRALRGERIRPEGDGDVSYAAAARRGAARTQGITQERIDADLETIDVPEPPGELPENPLLQYKGRRFTNAETGQPVYVSRAGATKPAPALKDPLRQAIAAQLPEVLRTMRKVAAEPDNENRRGVREVLRFVAAANTVEGVVPVRVTVHDIIGQGLNLHHFEVLESKTPRGAQTTAVPIRGPGPSALNPRRRLKVADLLQNVNREADGTYSADFSAAAPFVDEQRRQTREGIVPRGKGRAQQAAEAMPQLSTRQVAKQYERLRKALGPIARRFDLQVGVVADVLEAEGHTRAAAMLRAGNMADAYEAATAARHPALRALASEQYFIVVSAKAAQEGKLPGLTLHEIGHPYFDSLPQETKEILRELHQEETSTRTGPLYRDGKRTTNIVIEPEKFDQARLAADPDLPLKEWFVERVRALNIRWLEGRMASDHPTLLDVWRRLLERLRVIYRRFWKGVDEDVFLQDFRQWIATGGQPAGRRVAFAQADDEGTLPLGRPPGDIEAELAGIRAGSDQADPAELAERVKALEAELAQAKEAARAQQEEPPPGLMRGSDLELPAQPAAAPKPTRHPAAHGEVKDGEAWASVPTLSLEQLGDEAREIQQYLTDNYTSLAPAERKNLNSRLEAVRAETRRRTQPLPPVDRRATLIAQWREAKRLRDEGQKTGNDTAFDEGAAQMRALAATLDRQFPDWQDEVYAKKPTATPPAPKTAATREDDDGRNIPAEPPPEDPADGVPPAGDEPPPNRGRALEIHGHTAHTPGLGERMWRNVRDAVLGFRGPIPELPTFPALARKTDRFIADHGPQFYNRLREFVRVLNAGNDHVQKTAEEAVSNIVDPLLKLGGRFQARDYRLLQERREQVRRLKAEGQSVPAGAQAELDALNAKLEASPYVLFQRIVLMLDLQWRQRNLKDSADNPITVAFGLNATEVDAELARLAQQLEASDHKAAVEKALEDHVRLVEQVARNLKDRELLAAEHLNNPYYFPHITLEMRRGDKVEQRELRPERVRVGTEADFRGYLVDPVGSRKPVETDYVRAMYYHLVQVGAHNWKADAIRRYARPYDIREKVEARAKQLSKERDRAVSWEQAFHEEFEPEGYVLYGTESRDAFPAVQIDRDKLARRLGVELSSADLQKQLRELGLQGVTLRPDDLNDTLVQGARETWVVPARVAEALRGVADRQSQTDRPIEAGLKKLNQWWKAWKLFMPQSHVRYEYGNVVADLEKIVSASPRTLRYLGRAAKEVRDLFQGETLTADLRAAVREGAINTITAQEMQQLQRLRAFEKFQTLGERIAGQARRRASSILFQPVTNWFGLGDLSSVELSAFREGVFRYANYLANLEALRNGARPDYAGAYWKDIDAMTDSEPGANDKVERQAGQISKATFGDYSDLSVSGQYARDKLIPFYSWMEINWKYHANLLRNLRDMVKGDEISLGQASRKAARAVGALAVGKGARVAGGVVLRLALPYLAVAIWNSTGDREEIEEELSEEDRRRFHIIVGRDDEGRAQVIYANTALADVMKWFGGPRFAQAMASWLDGRSDFLTATSDWAGSLPADLLNITAGSAGPLAKIPYTLAAKKATFPDITDQRTIPAYDLRRNILSQITDEFTADLIERTIAKDYMPSKDLGDWAKQLVLQVRKRDAEAWAFYAIRDKAAAFYEDQTGRRRESNYDAPDQQVLRNFRRALYQGDVQAATQSYLRLLELGYTAERFAASIRAQDPLSQLPKQDGTRQAFVDALNEIDREILRRAYRYYAKMADHRGEERQLFPSERTGPAGLERYRANPRLDQLRADLEAATKLPDDAGEADFRRSMRRN